MHPHVEFLIMEAVLEHPKKTLSEISHDVYTKTGSDFVLVSIFYYLKRLREFLCFGNQFFAAYETYNFLFLVFR
mgnify:CR=1 FL=1